MTDPFHRLIAAGPDVVETHISTVFFSVERAYKLLKPIRTSFLDFSTAEKRIAAVDNEVSLNRRMAPDVYLGTADVEEFGDLVDRMIVMRRLPDDRRLTRLVASPDIDDMLRLIVRAVAAFHAAEPPIPDAVEIAGRDAVAANWEDNVADMESLVGEVFDEAEFARVNDLSRRYLKYSHQLFSERLARGFVRDGHGDLTADDIFCLDDGPRILDCLAFDRKLRVADVLCDIGFLAMDMDRLAGPTAAAAVWHYYAEFSNEHHPASLAHHYVAYRAHVRAKVATIRHRQGAAGAASSARSYLHLCLRHLEMARRRLAIVGGSPGSGKTTMSRVISERLGWSMIGSDQIRKELTGRGHTDRDFVEPGEGIYSAEISDRTYDELFRRANLLLQRGESVVLDASFNTPARRVLGRAVARESGADIVELECVLDSTTAKQRIQRRLERGDDPSDARPEILDELRVQQEPWPEAVPIETTGSFEGAATAALGAIRLR